MKYPVYTAIIACIYLALLPYAEPLIVDWNNQATKGVITLLQRNFGMDGGGLITLNITKVQPAGSVIYAAVYNEQQITTLDNGYSKSKDADDDSQQELCLAPAVLRAQVEAGETASLSVVADSVDRYSLLLLNCHSTNTAFVDGEILFLNPGGEHLSRELVPLIPVYAILLVTHLLLAFPWGYLCYKYRETLVNKIHALTSLALFARTISITLELAYLGTLHNTGYKYIGLKYTTDICSVLSSTVFLSLLVLTSSGWGIDRETLAAREKQMSVCAFTLYIIFGVLSSVCRSPSFCAAYELAFNVIKFLITFGVVVSMNASFERLRAFYSAEDMSMEDQLNCYLKSKMFVYFRWAFLAYFVFPILLLFVEVAVVRWQEMWMVVLLEELVVLGVFVMIASTFRPNPRNDYQTVLREMEANEIDLVSDDSDDEPLTPVIRRRTHGAGYESD